MRAVETVAILRRIAAAPVPLEHGAEYDENQHDGGDDPARAAKHAVKAVPNCAERLVQRVAGVAKDPGEIRAEKGIDQNQDTDQRKHWTERASGELDDNDDTEVARRDLERLEDPHAVPKVFIDDEEQIDAVDEPDQEDQVDEPIQRPQCA